MRYVFICHNSSERKGGNFLLIVGDNGVFMSASFYNCPNKKLSKKMINSLSHFSIGEYKEKDLNKFSDYLKTLFTDYDKIRIIQNYEVG